MSGLGHHIRIRLRDHRVIATDTIQRRELARVVLQQGRRDRLIVFGLADTHLHVEARCSRQAAGRLAQRVASSFKQRFGISESFCGYPPEPIRDGRHLYNTARYILTQRDRHGLGWDPFCETTNLPDLLGLRLLGEYTAENIRNLMPRIRREQLLSWMGVDALEPAQEPVHWVGAAALAAACLPSFAGGSTQVRAARCAAVEVIGSRLSVSETASVLQVSRRTVARLRNCRANPRLVCAIQLQLGLMSRRSGRPSSDAVSKVSMA